MTDREICMRRQRTTFGLYCSLPKGHEEAEHIAYLNHDLATAVLAAWLDSPCPTCGKVDQSYVCGSPDDPTKGMRCVLAAIVRDVSAERPTRFLARDYNEILSMLGVPTIGGV